MRIKLDENLPEQIAVVLRASGHDVHTAGAESLSGCLDSELWNAAQKESRFLITQDLDFSDLRRFSPGTHHGVLLLRLHSPSRTRLIERVEEFLRSEAIGEWERCFVVASDHKVRVRRPPTN